MGNDPDRPGTFDDWPDDGDGPDDSAEIEAYAAELIEAVRAFGVPVIEPGEWEVLP